MMFQVLVKLSQIVKYDFRFGSPTGIVRMAGQVPAYAVADPFIRNLTKVLFDRFDLMR
ncbi:hypothetical protein YDYSG_05060 [Paenibacillus tyrfis]|nr:hypothetical protein YDYSG_05060 [Paenibacillus tyrfis]